MYESPIVAYDVTSPAIVSASLSGNMFAESSSGRGAPLCSCCNRFSARAGPQSDVGSTRLRRFRAAMATGPRNNQQKFWKITSEHTANFTFRNLQCS